MECTIEATPEGGVTEAVARVPLEGSRAKPRPRKREHPPAQVGSDAEAYIARLVKARIEEGYAPMSELEQDAQKWVHFSARLDVYDANRVRDALEAAGFSVAASRINEHEGGSYPLHGSELVVDIDSRCITTTAKGDAAILAAAFLLFSNRDGLTLMRGDGADLNAMMIVSEAVKEGGIPDALREALYAASIIPRPINLATLRHPDQRRRAFQMSI